MKKIMCLIIVVLMVPSFALCEDLSSLSYADLLALSKSVTAELMKRPEWKEVTVPSGVWIIGDDIPEGTYSIACADKYGSTITVYADSSMKDGDFTPISGDSPLGKITLTNGMVVDISRAVIFAPPVVLGF